MTMMTIMTIMTGRGRAMAWVVLGMCLGAGATVVGLAQAGRLAPQRPEVLVALGQTLEVEHRQVDLLQQRGDVAEAIATLEARRTQPWPTAEEGGDAAIKLKRDVYGRLLRLRLDHPEIDPQSHEELLAIVEEGLAGASEDFEEDLFTSRLLAIQGELLEEMGRDDEALSVYERALEINQRLLDAELGDATP